MRKLTLSAEPEVIDMAKRLAGDRGTSVSEMFSQMIKSMAGPAHTPTPIRTRMATGLVKIPKGKTDHALIEEAISEKFKDEASAPRRH